MPSTYTLNNGIELIGTGEQSGTWGDTTNTNLGLLDAALDGQVTITLVAAGSSGSPNALPITDGTASNGRNRMVVFADGADLGATAYVQLTPNDAEKIIYIRNSLSGSRSVILFQGTYNASNDYEVPAGTTAVVYFDGAGAGAVAANVFNNAYFDGLRLGSVSVTAILDEDNMASDSATALATQQSIKAYVDAQVDTVDTLAEILAIGNTTGATDIAVDSAQKVQFRDAAIYINSSVDGQLDIVADTEIQIAATTIDVNGALDVSGTALVTGVLTTTAATVSNGGGQFNGAINVGVDDTGYDVKFFGATTGKSLLWDESADSLIVTGTTTLVGTTNLDAVDIDGATQIDATVTVGVDDTGYDVKFFGATAGAYMLWDESADDLILGGAAGLSVNSTALVTGVLTTTAATVHTGGITMPDNAKAIFGAGSDLQIYHDGGNSFVDEVGDGRLYIRASDGIYMSNLSNALYLSTYDTGGVSLYHNGSPKLVTTATGIDVTGTVTATGTSVFASLDISGDIDVDGTTNLDVVDIDGAVDMASTLLVTGVLTTTAATVSNGGGQFNGTVTVGVDDTGYDVKFFGATAGAYMLWDESADDLILGGAAGLSVNSAALVTGVLTANGGAVFNESGADVDFRVESDTKANAFFVEGSSGNVGIGSTSSATSRAVITDDGAVNDRLLFLDSSGGLGGGQAGPFYGLYSDIRGNNNSTAVYGAYLNATPAAGACYGVFAESTQDESTRDSIAIYGNATVNSASVNHRPNRALGAGPVAGVYATTSITGTSMSAETTALYALNASVYGSEAYGAWIETTAGPTTVVPLKVAHAGSELMRIDSSGGLITTPAAGGHAVFNEGGVDADFRVESDTIAAALTVDGGTGNVGVGSAGLTSTGPIATSAVGAAVTSFKSVCTVGDQTATSLILQSGRTDVYYHMQAFVSGSTEVFRIEASGNVKNTNNSYGALSDVKLKENIVDASPKLADLMQVKVRNYNLIGETTKQIGVVAQELETVFPSMVDESNDRDEDGNILETTTKGVKYSVFVPMLIKAIQEQQATITALTARITALENA
jgi:hypothetical protein